jgi:hypothetical protein
MMAFRARAFSSSLLPSETNRWVIAPQQVAAFHLPALAVDFRREALPVGYRVENVGLSVCSPRGCGAEDQDDSLKTLRIYLR